MEVEIFLAFFIFGTMSTMLSRRIFDKCANYVERFVVKWELANFKVENVHLHQFISKSLRWRVKYFRHLLSLEQCLQWCGGGFLINAPIM